MSVIFAQLSIYTTDSQLIIDYDRLESGVIFDEKSCFWKYIEKAIDIDPVTQEPVFVKLLNSTFSASTQRLYVSG